MLSWRMIVLLILFTLGVIGTYVPILHLHAMRGAVLGLLIAYGLARMRPGRGSIQGVCLSFLVLSVVWMGYGALACIWSIDRIAAFKELLDVGFGLGMAFVIHETCDQSPFKVSMLRCAWQVGFLFTGLIAAWELSSGQHLDSSFLDQIPPHMLEERWIMSTFGNPNNYAAFLLLTIPFQLGGIAFSRIRMFRAVSLCAFLVALYLIVTTGCRGVLIGVILELVIFSFCTLRWTRAIGVLSTVCVAMAVATFFYANWTEEGETSRLLRRLDLDAMFDSSNSFGERYRIYGNGLFMVVNSVGLGVGPHQFANHVFSPKMPFHVDVPNPHNFWIEIASQYGLVIFIGFVAWLFQCVVELRRAIRHGDSGYQDGAIMLAAVGGYLIASIENSSYIPQPTNWLFLGSLLAVSDYRYADVHSEFDKVRGNG